MRILLTGTSGQVGGALLPRLQGFGQVIAPNETEFDLTQPVEISRILDQASPDLIINPAAYTAVDKAEDEPELARRVNAGARGHRAVGCTSWRAADSFFDRLCVQRRRGAGLARG